MVYITLQNQMDGKASGLAVDLSRLGEKKRKH